jgi:thiol:disulfide interchange protein
MKRGLCRWGLLAFSLLAASMLMIAWVPSPAIAQVSGQSLGPPYSTHFELYRLSESNAPGQSLLAVFTITPDEGYYVYANKPGESPGESGQSPDQSLGQPTVVLPKAGPDGTVPAVLYPPGTPRKDLFEPDKTILAYQGPTPIFLRPPDVDSPLSLSLELRMLLCSEERCWPVRKNHAHTWDNIDLKTLPIANEQSWWSQFLSASPGKNADAAPQVAQAIAPAPPAQPTQTGQPPEWNFTPRYFNASLEVQDMAKALLLAFLAGIILNLMPCVLPVIGIKLGALVSAASSRDEERRHKLFRDHVLFFALGVLLFFLCLSLLLGLAGMMWGELFQNSTVVLILAAVVLLLALSLFGVFTLPIADLKAPSELTKTPRLQALSTGFLATLLATPCSAPLLGGVLAWAAPQPPLVLSIVFLCVGLGMASPYLAMAARPGLVRFFPKPGAWTGTLEKLVGFFLLATCVYLLSILSTGLLIPALAILLAVGCGAWMWGGWAGLGQTPGKRLLIRVAALLLLATVTFIALRPSPPGLAWEPFSVESFNAALGREAILVEFTADWCPTCKVLERTSLSAEHVGPWQNEYGLRLFRADLTTENPEAAALLRALGGASIPTTAIFPKDEGHNSPLVLRDLFTPGQMKEALESTFY